MEREYDRAERVAFSGWNAGGSSARMVDADTLDPAARRRKDAEAEATARQYIEMFCNRYRDRGIAGRVHADAAKQEKQEALNRAIAPGAYVMTETLENERNANAYRTGMSDGKPYMTVDDFARYYHDQRGYKFPQYRTVASVRPGEAAMAVEARAAEGELRSKKAGWLADTDKCPAPVRKLMKYRFVRFLNEWAGETFPREAEIRRAPVQKRRLLPAGVVASLVTVAVSMSLVIGSTVLVSQSTRELSQLKQEVGVQEEIIDRLSDELALKNDALGIEQRAQQDLGMVPERYLSAGYIQNDAEDYIEIYDGTTSSVRRSGLSALLSAFGFGE